MTAAATTPTLTVLPGSDVVPLAALRRGQSAVVREMRLATDDAALVRAMGLCDCAHLTVCREGEPCVVTVRGIDAAKCGCAKAGAGGGWGGCRIGLSRPMAERILVSVVD